MTEPSPFINYLLERVAQDRGALAALRGGLGRAPGEAPAMLPYVVPFTHESTPWWRERCLYMVASLFALHPTHTSKGNLGDHLARLRSSNDKDNVALERRFTQLLAAHHEELDVQLRRTIAYLKSKDVPVNWHQLLADIQRWAYPESQARVRRDWAMRFWNAAPTTEDPDNTPV